MLSLSLLAGMRRNFVVCWDPICSTIDPTAIEDVAGGVCRVLVRTVATKTHDVEDGSLGKETLGVCWVSPPLLVFAFRPGRLVIRRIVALLDRLSGLVVHPQERFDVADGLLHELSVLFLLHLIFALHLLPQDEQSAIIGIAIPIICGVHSTVEGGDGL